MKIPHMGPGWAQYPFSRHQWNQITWMAEETCCVHCFPFPTGKWQSMLKAWSHKTHFKGSHHPCKTSGPRWLPLSLCCGDWRRVATATRGGLSPPVSWKGSPLALAHGGIIGQISMEKMQRSPHREEIAYCQHIVRVELPMFSSLAKTSSPRES